MRIVTSFVVPFVALPAALVAAPAGSPAPSPAPASVPAKAPGFEVVLSEALVGAMLTAVMPYETVMEQEIGALGLTKTVQVNVRLSNPRTRVTREGVKVTVDYVLNGGGGMFDRSGTATPTLTLTPVPARRVIEGRLTNSGVFLPGGIELPLESLVEPIEIPAVVPQEVEAGDKVIAAEARMTEVVLEDGRIRVRGTATFRPK